MQINCLMFELVTGNNLHITDLLLAADAYRTTLLETEHFSQSKA
jgi:hypothetical protein